MLVCEVPSKFDPSVLVRGTYAGYMKHRRAGDLPGCPECVAANREYKKKNRHRWKSSRPYSEWSEAQKEKKRAASREYKRRNRERLNEYSREWRNANPEYFKAWKAKNPGYMHAYQKLWREINEGYLQNWRAANPARIRRYEASRRGAKTLGYDDAGLAGKAAMWGDRCWLCDGDWDSWDHVKPISAGGIDCLSNLRPACRSCNSSKGSEWPWPTR